MGAFMSNNIIIIHGRFEPNGTVAQISECPSALTPQEWFNFLSQKAADAYRTLAGARIIFRLAPDRLEALKAESTAA